MTCEYGKGVDGVNTTCRWPEPNAVMTGGAWNSSAPERIHYRIAHQRPEISRFTDVRPRPSRLQDEVVGQKCRALKV
jgi:hypothetical protein